MSKISKMCIKYFRFLCFHQKMSRWCFLLFLFVVNFKYKYILYYVHDNQIKFTKPLHKIKNLRFQIMWKRIAHHICIILLLLKFTTLPNCASNQHVYYICDITYRLCYSLQWLYLLFTFSNIQLTPIHPCAAVLLYYTYTHVLLI